MQNKRFGAFSSSENPDELALRVKGVILALGTVIVYAAAHLFHINLTPTDVVTLATDASGAIAALVVAYGAVKAVVIWAIDKYHNLPTVNPTNPSV